MDLESLYQLYLAHPAVQTDTRRLKSGDLFFALKGPNFNGNAFAEKSLRMGAAYAVIDEESYRSDERMILVDDVLVTLQRLARHHRDQFSIPVIAITGSNGKTTTKELTRAVLSTRFKAYATEGNLNNHIGVPLTILKITADVDIAIIEMGANHQREIAAYCEIANPTHGLITNVGKAHLEGFGGLEGVRKGKGELFDHLRASGGTAFACSDFDYFGKMTRGIREIVWYGTTADGPHTATIISAHPLLRLRSAYAGTIGTQLVGNYNLYNVLAALTIGAYFNVAPADARQAVETYHPGNARSERIILGTNTIILDAYNANPSSMQAAIENFAASPAPAKVLMLGAMMELGSESLAEHERLISLIKKYHWERVVLVGGDFQRVTHPYLYLPDAAAAGRWLVAQHFSNTAILLKGSRSISMEKALPTQPESL